jgi:hypothetical protein
MGNGIEQPYPADSGGNRHAAGDLIGKIADRGLFSVTLLLGRPDSDVLR